MTKDKLLRMVVDLQERVTGLEMALAQHERIRHEKPSVRGPMSPHQRIGTSPLPATVDQPTGAEYTAICPKRPSQMR